MASRKRTPLIFCVKKVGDDAPISLLVLLNGPRICAGLLVGKHNDTQMAGKWFVVASALCIVD
jgi:hypothetical protein